MFLQRAVDLLRHSPTPADKIGPLPTLPELDSSVSAGCNSAPGVETSPTAAAVSVPATAEGAGQAGAESGTFSAKEALGRHRTIHCFSSSEEVPASPFAAVQESG